MIESGICRCAECAALDKIEVVKDPRGAQAFRQPTGWFGFVCGSTYDGTVDVLFFCSEACIDKTMKAIALEDTPVTSSGGSA